MSEPETMKINNVEYIRKDSVETKKAESLDGMPYMIVRTYSAGVFAGYLKSRNGQEAEVLKARRIWKWSGAASLSQLAMEGTKTPKNCKFPCEVDRVILTNVVELLDVTEKAKDSIDGVKIWTA